MARGLNMTDERRSVLHSWCVQADWNAPTVTGGEGAFFRDEHGRRYLDMSSLAECMNLGHQHPAVVRAIREQAERLCFVTAAWGAEPRARLAERLLQKSGFEGGRVFFTLGGADANEHAVKFARQASGRPRGWVLTRDRSYHGASYAAMALSGDARVSPQVDAGDFHVEHVPPPYAYRCPFGSTSDAECAERSASARRSGDRPARSRRGRGGADGAERRDQRHRGAGRLLAAPPRGDARSRRVPDRRRGDERLRALRRVVRVAAPRRGRPARPDDARQGPDGRPPAARRCGALRRRRRPARARAPPDRPHLLRAPAGLRRGAGGPAGLRGRGPRRALAGPGLDDARRRSGPCRTACR